MIFHLNFLCGLVAWFLAFIALVFLCLFVHYRKNIQLQLRCPNLTFGMSASFTLLLIVIGFEEVTGLPCAIVLWSSTIFTISGSLCFLFRAWTILVFSDRNLRKQFRWTTQKSFVLKVISAHLFYSSCIAAATQCFDKQYLIMLHRRQCYFVMPLEAFIPQYVPETVFSVFLAWKLTKTDVYQEGLLRDAYGISDEILGVNISLLLFFAAFYTYAPLCLLGKIDEKFPTAFLILWFSWSVSMFLVVLPVLKVLRGRKKQQESVILVREASPKTFDQEGVGNISIILQNKVQAPLFRKHALKALCAENVDFCIEVLGFQESVLSVPTSVQELYEAFLSITREFVDDGSPSEVNLSWCQKAAILKYVGLDSFTCLDQAQRSSIFEQALLEIMKLLSQNLLASFQQDQISESRQCGHSKFEKFESGARLISRMFENLRRR